MSEQTPTKPTSLAHKLTCIMDELEDYPRRHGTFDFGVLRNMLGQKRILLLPNIKDHQEITIERPGEPLRVRTTVIVEIQLIDGESSEKLTSQWIGRAFAPPEVAYDEALTKAIEDFLQKTFLLLDMPAPAAPRPVVSPQPQVSAIRRRPQDSTPESPKASPATALPPQQSLLTQPANIQEENEEQETPTQVEEVVAPQNIAPPSPQLELLNTVFPDEAAVLEDEPEVEPPHMTDEVAFRAWKAANAQWRVLVSRVVSADVMAMYENAVEHKYGVNSWRKVSPEQIRENAFLLRKRSDSTSDTRRISDREEYILSQLPHVPEGASLDRIQAEIERLVLAVTTEQTHRAFMELYLQKMHTDHLSKITGRALISLTRKIRKLQANDRRSFVHDALGIADHNAA